MFKKIVIVGLGLMGGSLAAAARKKYPHAKIVGVARRQATLDFARRKKWIHEGFSKITADALRQADLVVLCAPVEVNLHLLAQIEKTASVPLLVTDVGSVKKPICDLAQKLKLKKISFVGAHPMVGSHEQGIECATADLYSQGITVITPSGKKSADQMIFSFWKKFSKNVVKLNSAQHDQSIALVSHLPHLLAVCLMASADDKSLQVMGSGFRDMTRLAAGPASVWDSIFRQNASTIIQTMNLLEKQLAGFKSILRNPNTSQLSLLLNKQSSRRKKI